MNKDLLERYADIKDAIADFEKQAESLKPEILAMLQKEGADEVNLKDRGNFVVVPKRKWKYPAPIVTMEEELKKAKTEAEAKGEATWEENPYVMFKPVKKD